MILVNGVICNQCQKNCVLDVMNEDGILQVIDNDCEKGLEYAKAELEENKRIFTTLVRIKGANCNVVSVKSSKPIEKSLWIECSRALSRLYAGAPIKIGDIICKNILNTGVDIICTKNLNKAK